MRAVPAWLFVVLLAAAALTFARMARCNFKRFLATRTAPPLVPGGRSGRGAAAPWGKAWQPWPKPRDLNRVDAQRYADLAAARASARRVAAEVVSVMAAAGLGALLPAMFDPHRHGGLLVGAAFGLGAAAIALSSWLRDKASFWERVVEIYDDQAALAGRRSSIPARERRRSQRRAGRRVHL